MRFYILFPSLALGILYLLFPTINSTIDAYCYASDIKYQFEIFNPHHLLYNALGFGIYTFFENHVDSLALMKVINALFATGCLVVTGLIMEKFRTPIKLISALLILAGSTFGVMRFATENETYIVPVFFSLVGTYFWVHSVKSERKLDFFFSGFFLALACLFHQIHFFWWLIIGISISLRFIGRHFLNVFWYFLPAVIVPACYILVYVHLNKHFSISGLFEFIFREFYKGNVDTEITLNNLILTGINFIRTWIQIHGNLLQIIQSNNLLALLGIAAAILIISGLFLLFRERKTYKYSNYIKTLIAIGIGQLVFAFYSVGNAEFMVMLPFIICLILASKYQFKPSHIFLLAGGGLMWNLSLAIIPAHANNLTSSNQLVDRIKKQKNVYFLVKDKVQIESEYVYEKGKYPNNIIFPPEYCQKKYGDVSVCIQKLDSVINLGIPVITDCYGNQQVMSRGSFLSGNLNEKVLLNYTLQKTDSIIYDLGTTYLYRVTKK